MAKEQPSRKQRLHAFDVVNYIVFILIGLLVLVPIWKVLVDSFNAVGVYQFQLWPSHPTVDGYKTIIQTSALYRPFINSVVTTILGTLLGLVNNMWILVFKHGMNVYNLVLMRNFFEGIPDSLYEAAELDGCSPMGIFFKIVLPLSKAALASIGLMFAVTVWNDYTTVKIYITDPDQVNFQYKLRNMIMDGDTPTTAYNVSQNTLFNAGIIAAILPFMILYPFLQKYFVTGVNIGAVKE